MLTVYVCAPIVARELRLGGERARGDAADGRLATRASLSPLSRSPLSCADETRTRPDAAQWTELLPITPLGPAQPHLFLFPHPSTPVTHLKLTMHPDGGIGRFRAYGKVLPAPAKAGEEAIDLAYVLNGATVQGESDQHFGRGGNLILPGRGRDMGDGWETKRSRGRLGTGGGDWVVIKLGEKGYLEWVDLDTLHFVGNFPSTAALFAINSTEDLPAEGAGWTKVLEETKLGPHRQHFFALDHPDRVWTHIKLAIYPDGGVKRVRAYGRRASQFPDYKALTPLPNPQSFLSSVKNALTPSSSSHGNSVSEGGATTSVPKVPAVPLTPDAFSAYGSVIQSYPDQRSARKDVVVKPVNFGTAFKFNHLAPVSWVQPTAPQHASVTPEVNFCVFRCDEQNGLKNASGKETWEVKVLERHEFSSQAFLPMGRGGDRYLVLVALGGAEPDLGTLKVFMATSAQGISYKPGVWHHPLIALDKTTDFACVVNETGVAEVDCEIHQFGRTVAVVEEV